ncbi:hypothetical protein ABNA11_004073 [Escherichia coli]
MAVKTPLKWVGSKARLMPQLLPHWLPLVAAVLVAFLIDFWRKWVNRG